MKKFLLPVVVFATLGFASCGGIDVDKAADEFCACKESEDPTKCRKDWVAKYKDAAGTEEDGKKLGEKIAECDPAGLMEIAGDLQ